MLNFIVRLRWATEKNPEGGITWLELYAWYRMHAERKTPAPFEKVDLKKEICAFKKGFEK